MATALFVIAAVSWLATAPPLVVVTVVVAALLFGLARDRQQTLVAACAIGFSSLAAAAAVIDLKFVPQVADLAAANADPLIQILDGRLWGPRYAVVYPSVVLAHELHVPLNEAFTAYGCGLLAVEAFVLFLVVGQLSRREGAQVPAAGVLIVVMVLGIATAMNGRLIPAHLGMSLILLAQTTSIQRKRTAVWLWILTGGGLFLALMTTGTAVAALVQVAGGGLLLQIRARQDRGRSLVALSLLLLLIGPFVWQGMEKNVQFFGGPSAGFESVIEAFPGLLTHGAGSLLLVSPLALVVGILTGLIAARLFLLIFTPMVRGGDPQAALFLCLPVAFVTGLFGYSTLTMGLPALEVLTAVWILRASRLAVGRRRTAPA